MNKTFDKALRHARNLDGMIFATPTCAFTTDGAYAFTSYSGHSVELTRLLGKSELMPKAWHAAKAARFAHHVERLKRLAQQAISTNQLELAKQAMEKAIEYQRDVEKINARQHLYYRLPQVVSK